MGCQRGAGVVQWLETPIAVDSVCSVVSRKGFVNTNCTRTRRDESCQGAARTSLPRGYDKSDSKMARLCVDFEVAGLARPTQVQFTLKSSNKW